MPLLSEKQINDNLTVAIWQIVENDDALFFDTFGNKWQVPTYLSTKNQQLQWMCTRLLLQAIGIENEINYDKYNKPFLVNSSAHISVSHSYNTVAVVVNTNEETGIDIELMKGKAKLISKKFMNDTELAQVDSNNEQAYYVYWCAKESLYKLYGKKELIFKDNILVSPFMFKNYFTFKAMLAVSNIEKKYLLAAETIGDFMLVYTLKQIS
jgi:phosphopantetheinyl transferase (holo-ACP synthase)